MSVHLSLILRGFLIRRGHPGAPRGAPVFCNAALRERVVFEFFELWADGDPREVANSRSSSVSHSPSGNGVPRRARTERSEVSFCSVSASVSGRLGGALLGALLDPLRNGKWFLR